MSKLYLFAPIFLFWAALTASLAQVQLLTSPVHKLRVPTHRSMPARMVLAAQLNTSAAPGSYN